MLSFDHMDDFGRWVPNFKRVEPTNKKENALEKNLRQIGDFTITYIDDNSVHLRDSLGHEVAFQYPLENMSIDDHDKFVEQMKNKDAPPPPLDAMIMTMSKPLIDPSREVRRSQRPNSGVQAKTWEQLSEDHGIDVERLMQMFVLARNALYERFKTRLRRKTSTD